MIHFIKESKCYVISSRHVWIPGVYDKRSTAQFAFQFKDEELRKLQDSINPNEVITKEMLQHVRIHK